MLEFEYCDISDMQYNGESILSAHFLNRFYEYKNEKDKLRVFVSYQILKKMLAEKNIELDKLRIVTENNKPEFDFEDVGLYFNISHSGNIVAVALCDCPVGIDVQIEKTPNIKLCERYFGKIETNKILKSKNANLAYAKHWADYESLIKLINNEEELKNPKLKLNKVSKTLKDKQKNNYALCIKNLTLK